MFNNIYLKELSNFSDIELKKTVIDLADYIDKKLDFKVEQSSLKAYQEINSLPSLEVMNGLRSITKIVIEKGLDKSLVSKLIVINNFCQKIITAHPNYKEIQNIPTKILAEILTHFNPREIAGINTVAKLWKTATECREIEVMASSTYQSLTELKQKASINKIKFLHNLSELTYSKINNEVLEFFIKHGGLVDENSTPAPHVKIVGDFAIDTKSRLFRSRFGGVRLGQNIVTKQFLAFKPELSKLNNKPAIDSKEVYWLKKFERFRGIISDHVDYDPDICYIAMDLIDGLNFMETVRFKLFTKINHHARYLIAYNTVKAFEDFKTKSIKQCDTMPSNFMISANFDVKIIDFGWLENAELIERRSCFHTTMISDIFLADCEGNISKDISVIKKYQHGTFENLTKFVENKIMEKCSFIDSDDIIEVLPSLI